MVQTSSSIIVLLSCSCFEHKQLTILEYFPQFSFSACSIQQEIVHLKSIGTTEPLLFFRYGSHWVDHAGGRTHNYLTGINWTELFAIQCNPTSTN